MSTCGEVGSDMHALIKEVAIRRVEHRSETLQRVPTSGEGDGSSTSSAAILFVLQQALSFRTLHHLCRQGVALASARQLRSQGPVSEHETGKEWEQERGWR